MSAREPGLRSMTGFGAVRGELRGLSCEVELRAVNHRSLKFSPRLPEGLNAQLPALEELVRSVISRGTVYLNVRLGGGSGAGVYRLDEALLRRLHGELTAFAAEVGQDPPRVAELAALPGVVREEEAGQLGEDLGPELLELCRGALHALEAMRRTEGAGLAQDLLANAEAIARLAEGVEAQAPEVVNQQAQRLRGRIEQLLGDASLEPRELAREVALLADKTDISEELQRLRSHVDQLRTTVAEAARPVGRKLEFLAQELLREANTMASKSHSTALIDPILELKLHVDRIREQVANVE